MSDQGSSRTEQLLILLADELQLIRFLLTYPEREGLTIGGKPADDIVNKMEADIDRFREDLGL